MELITRSPNPVTPRVRAVKIISGFKVWLAFENGAERELDLEPYLHGPIFEPLRSDPQLFAAVQIDEVGDTICWPNGADIAPETLYENSLAKRIGTRARTSRPKRTIQKKPARRARRKTQAHV